MRLANARFLAILDTMWGSRGQAPRWFPINPLNHSGRRLYKLTGSQFPQVWVANACPQSVGHARAHGTPSPVWLESCLLALPPRLRCVPLLVCGTVARATYRQLETYTHVGPVLYLLHPAARTWTAKQLRATQRKITLL